MLMNMSPNDTDTRQPATASRDPGRGDPVQSPHRGAGQGFARDAQIALEEQAPRGGTLVIYLALLLIVGFGVWASVTQIDEVARGEGRIVPAGSVHVVHSMDGGVVEKILVKEGERVVQGQPLVHIEAVRADAALGETRSRRGTMTARFERLRAEASGQAAPRFGETGGASDPLAVSREKQIFEARRQELSAQLQVVDGQIEQRRAEAEETSRRRDATIAALALLQREYDVSKPLSRTGAVSEFDMVRLEREIVRTRGEIASAAAALERLAGARSEALARRQELEQAFLSRARQELAEVAAELDRTRENARGLDDRVSKTVLKAPVAGIVKVLHARTPGGVVQPGKEVLEIVPSEDTLLVEARIAPKDIARLRTGMPATVRLSAYDYAVFGGLPATLEHVGPDTLADDKGNPYYLVRVRTRRDSGAAASAWDRHPILPGMMATVDVMTGQRTVATYLLKPILRARQLAFTES